MAKANNDGLKRSAEVPLCAFIILLLTHCYAVLAILDRRVYVDEDVRKNYKIEDFLWPGSGDGENETELTATPEQPTWERTTTTVFHTTTIISTSTVFYNSLSTVISDTSIDCSNGGSSSCFIAPTPTVSSAPNTADISPWPPPTDYPSFADIPDQRYWLITVLKTNGTNAGFVPFDLEEHLAKLYKIAFHRHQERHLGLGAAANATNKVRNRAALRSTRTRREHHQRGRDTVTVHIHNVSSDDVFNILYSVRVSGLPVLAATAAHDMKLVSDAEVVAELGYPVLTKAEPYLKPPPSLREVDASLNKDYIVVLISSVCAAAFFSVLLFYVVLSLKKRLKPRVARTPSPPSTPKKGQFVVASSSKKRSPMHDGVDNAAFVCETDRSAIGERSQTRRKSTPDTNGKAVAAAATMAAVNPQYYSRLPSDRAASPNSFLSMPSVRNFPTTPLPEPLTNLLNTSSSPPSGERERDGAAAATTEEDRMKLSRHGSLGGEDPGVVGPMVWHVHRHRVKKAGTAAGADYNDERSSPDSDVDMGQMRKRLNRLLDDALSLHDTRRSPDAYDDVDGAARFRRDDSASYSFHQTEIRRLQRRSQSPATRDDNLGQLTQPRPRLYMGESAPRSAGMPQARGAWMSAGVTPSTPARLRSRPLSAGPFHRPVICPEFILSDAHLPPTDPIVPVISAIKQELDKIPEYKREPLDRRLGGVLKSKLSSMSSRSDDSGH